MVKHWRNPTKCPVRPKGKYEFNVMMNFQDKGKIFYVHAKKTKAYRWSRGTTPIILNLGTRWEWLTSPPACFIPGKNPRYPLNRRLRYLDVQEKRKISRPYRDSNPGLSST